MLGSDMQIQFILTIFLSVAHVGSKLRISSRSTLIRSFRSRSRVLRERFIRFALYSHINTNLSHKDKLTWCTASRPLHCTQMWTSWTVCVINWSPALVCSCQHSTNCGEIFLSPKFGTVSDEDTTIFRSNLNFLQYSVHQNQLNPCNCFDTVPAFDIHTELLYALTLHNLTAPLHPA